MSYFVRKIKKSNLPKIKTASTISQVLADVLDEYRVSNGDLSVWEIPTNSQADIEKAALALAITNEKLSKMDLLIIDTQIVTGSGFTINSKGSGHNLPSNLESMHKNIGNLTVGNIDKCVELYAKTIKTVDLTKTNNSVCPRYPDKKILEIIKNALDNKIIEKENINYLCQKNIFEKDPTDCCGLRNDFIEVAKGEIKELITNGIKNKVFTKKEIQDYCNEVFKNIK